MAEFVGWNLDPALTVKAAEMAERAIELSPLSPLSVTSLAAVEMGRLRPDKAIELAERAVVLAPSSFEGFSILGIAQIQMGDLEEGRVSLEQAVRLNPMAVDINYTILGFAKLNTGDPESAVGLWERVRAENEEALPDRIFLVHYYQTHGRADRARVVTMEILKVDPSYTAAHAVQFLSLLGAVPEEEEEIVMTADFRLAGLP